MVDGQDSATDGRQPAVAHLPRPPVLGLTRHDKNTVKLHCGDSASLIVAKASSKAFLPFC